MAPAAVMRPSARKRKLSYPSLSISCSDGTQGRAASATIHGVEDWGRAMRALMRLDRPYIAGHARFVTTVFLVKFSLKVLLFAHHNTEMKDQCARQHEQQQPV